MEKNKVYFGDCLELMKDIEDKSIDMILCDLPYQTTACHWDILIPFEPLWEQYKRIIVDDGNILLFADEPFTSVLICSNLEQFRQRITWDKQVAGNFLNSKKMLLKVTEDVCLFTPSKLGNQTYNPQVKNKDDDKIRPIGNRKPFKGGYIGKTNGQLSKDYQKDKSFPTNLFSYNSRAGDCNTLNRKHPTQKPVALFEYLIKTYTNEGDLVLDNCAGSGTTAIACLNTNRNYILMEKEQKYFDIINERIKRHTENQKIF